MRFSAKDAKQSLTSPIWLNLDFKSSASAIPPPGPGRYKKVAFMGATLNVASVADMPRGKLGCVSFQVILQMLRNLVDKPWGAR